MSLNMPAPEWAWDMQSNSRQICKRKGDNSHCYWNWIPRTRKAWWSRKWSCGAPLRSASLGQFLTDRSTFDARDRTAADLHNISFLSNDTHAQVEKHHQSILNIPMSDAVSSRAEKKPGSVVYFFATKQCRKQAITQASDRKTLHTSGIHAPKAVELPAWLNKDMRISCRRNALHLKIFPRTIRHIYPPKVPKSACQKKLNYGPKKLKDVPTPSLTA